MLSGIDKFQKIVLIGLFVLVALSQIACAQSREEKLKLSYEHEDKALELRRKGDLQSAIGEQQKAIEINSNDSKPFTVLAGMYIEANDWQKAQETLEKAIKIDANDAVAYHMLANISRRQENKEKTLEYDKKSVAFDSRNTNYLTNLGVDYGGVNDKKLQRQSYEKALTIDPNYLDAIYNLALLEAEEKNNEKATELFKKFIEKSSSTEDAESIERAKAKIKELEQPKK